MIRPAGVADADAIAHVHVQGWREAYPGLVPDAVLASVHRRGFGRGLMREAARSLRDAGHRAVGLWVLSGNATAIAFYAALGGRKVAERTETARGYAVDEVGMLWDDVNQLIPEAQPAT
jgi:predicted N-acetyltransferase YhbS